MKLEKKLNSDSLLTTYFNDIEPGDINKLYNIYHDDFNFFHYDIQVTINENNEFTDSIKKRGCVIVRDVFDDLTISRLNKDLQNYIEENNYYEDQQS